MRLKYRANTPWVRLYKTARWQRLREAQLAQQPLCEWCIEVEQVTEATEVHHQQAHKGDLDLFWGGPFISTCKSCHASRGQREDRGEQRVEFAPDGWPVDD